MTDYSTTKPTNPWSLAHNLSLVAADLDGDGFEEVVAIACDSVGVLKYFDWSELSSGWSDVTSFGGW